jgi:hypothetical protein
MKSGACKSAGTAFFVWGEKVGRRERGDVRRGRDEPKFCIIDLSPHFSPISSPLRWTHQKRQP